MARLLIHFFFFSVFFFQYPYPIFFFVFVTLVYFIIKNPQKILQFKFFESQSSSRLKIFTDQDFRFLSFQLICRNDSKHFFSPRSLQNLYHFWNFQRFQSRLNIKKKVESKARSALQIRFCRTCKRLEFFQCWWSLRPQMKVHETRRMWAILRERVV